MVRKRYISTEISIDTKVLELADNGFLSPLLYTWAIPHMDDWGRITGDTREFKALVCPGLDITNKEVEEAINQIVSVDLWVRYEVDGKKCISVSHQSNWFKHQSYISKEKRNNDAGSYFPTPPQNTEERRRTPRNAEEEQETPQNPSSFSFSVSSSVSSSKEISSSSSIARNPFSLFSDQGFGKLDSITAELVGDLVDTYSEKWVMKALVEAIRQGEKKLSYVTGILKRWQKTNHPEPWTLEKEPESKGKPSYQNRYGSNKPKLSIVETQPDEPMTDEELAEIRMMADKLKDQAVIV